MQDLQRLALNELRQAGYAVCVFSPEELRDASARQVEARMAAEGNETIDALVGTEPESDGDSAAAPCQNLR